MRSEWKKIEDEKIKKMLKDEEIEICQSIVEIAPYLTKGNGDRITTPVFPLILGLQK